MSQILLVAYCKGSQGYGPGLCYSNTDMTLPCRRTEKLAEQTFNASYIPRFLLLLTLPCYENNSVTNYKVA